MEEEKYELPTGEYPKIVDVPDRPRYPAPKEVFKIQKSLELSRDAAAEAAKPPV